MTSIARARVPVLVVAVVLGLSALFVSGAEGATVLGSVRDATTSAPVEGVLVQLVGAAAAGADAGAVIAWSGASSSGGLFVIPDAPPGTWTIVASRLGYAPARVSCSVAEGPDTLHVMVPMTASALPLEVTVVTASRREEPLERVPAAVTVLRSRDVQERPADNFGALLRNVPGVNVSQASAFDMSVSSRNATGVLPQGQLAMVDNRTVYQDYNGFVLWSAVPVDPLEIRQIEVVRGPGSAVWGANAVDGVINVLTKSPREMKGTVIRAGGGELGAANIHAVHAAEHGRWSYRLSGGWSQQDPYDRPEGTIPGTEGPANPGGTPYPEYPNEGLDQPRGSGRLDFQADERTTLSLSGGYAGISGIFLTPIGPYSFDDASAEAFLKLDWVRKSARISAFTNRNEVDGRFLLGGQSASHADLYDVNFSGSRNAGTKHVLAYGANARHADYEIDFAPGAEARSSAGTYVQDEVTIARRFRWFLGARWDYIEDVGHAVSPRTGLLFSPREEQTLRVSYNRAFLAPSPVEMHLDVRGATTFTIPTPGGPLDLVLPTHSKGNPDLESETLDAFELGWTGKVGRAVQLSLSLYRNVLSDHIQIVPTSFYTSASPPPGWPLPDSLLDVPPPNGFAGIPSELSYVNVGEVTNQGFEVAFEFRPVPPWSGFVNYSWQDVPSLEGSDPAPLPNGGSHDPINTPPRHRFNAGAGWRSESFYVNGDVNVQSEAFWTDVLDSRYWGPTEGFVGVNLGAGVHFSRERATLAVNARNVFDERIQQHVWGDVLTRKVTAQVTLRL